MNPSFGQDARCAHPTKRYIALVLPFFRQAKWLLIVGTVLAIALRLLFIVAVPHVTGDTFIYGDIAKNWVDHGIYGFTQLDGPPNPTWIRLPGYPGFLAICFFLFGREHYTAVMLVQLVFDICTCFLIADLARRMAGDRAGKIAFLLACLCPFTANYVASPMPEVLSVFSLAAAFWCFYVAVDRPARAWPFWIGCGLFTGLGTILRPDGGILLAAFGLFLLIRLWRVPEQRRNTFVGGILVLVVALAPLVPWTIRNWKTFEHFEPLAPRYASDLDEFTPLGYNHWVRTWMAEYVSVEDIYWQMPGQDVDVNLLPKRAYDNPTEEARTRDLFAQYQTRTAIWPELDQQFEQLAQERVKRHPLRYYLQLPLMRITDMWLRPRTETLPLDSRWWQDYTDDFWNSARAAGLGLINLLYVGLAIAGCFLRPRPRHLFVVAAFLLIRTTFLGTLENPETRYTLECYPLIIALASSAIAAIWQRWVFRNL
jgi:4-amino-4-deoxy-L-arabinose transferase-like glycosyltransferase